MKPSTEMSNGHPAASQRTWTDAVKQQPMVFLAAAAAAGFIVGGGTRSKEGLMLLAFIGRLAAREAMGHPMPDTLNEAFEDLSG